MWGCKPRGQKDSLRGRLWCACFRWHEGMIRRRARLPAAVGAVGVYIRVPMPTRAIFLAICSSRISVFCLVFFSPLPYRVESRRSPSTSTPPPPARAPCVALLSFRFFFFCCC